MVDTDNPVDYARTSRPRVGMIFKDRRETPGLGLMIVAVLALVGCMTTVAMRNTDWAIGLGVVVLVVAVSGLSWIFVGRSRCTGGGRHRAKR